MPQHNVRSAIPLTNQTDPNKFPPYQYHPYPRMMLQANGKPFTHRNGQPVVVQDEREEKAFRDSRPDAAHYVRPTERVQQIQDENERLKRLLAEHGIKDAPTSSPVITPSVQSLVQEQKAAEVEQVVEGSDGLDISSNDAGTGEGASSVAPVASDAKTAKPKLSERLKGLPKTLPPGGDS